MRGLAKHLQLLGFTTWNWTWPSRKMPVAAAAAAVHAQLLAELGPRALTLPICAVTHSLGGVVALRLSQLLPLQRVVLLAPPLQGSRAARAFVHLKIFQWFYGPAGSEVAVPAADWHSHGRIEALGVIAGTAGLHWGNPISWATRALGVLPAELASDGTVAAAETRPAADHHYVEVPATHTWIMDDSQVRDLVVKFLRTAQFGP